MSSGGKKSSSVGKNQQQKQKKVMIQHSVGGSQVQYKLPKGHHYDEQGIEKRLKKSSPWYQSIMNPIEGAGAKIPDATGIPTGTFQNVQTLTVPVNAQGIAGARIVSPYPNGGSVPANGRNYQITAAASNIADLWTGGVTAAFAGYAGITPALVRGSRIVSAAIFAEYEGTALADSGDFTCYQSPFGANADNTALAVYQSSYAVAIVPINRSKDKPVVSRWYPIATGSSITNSTDPSQLIPTTRDYRTFCTATGIVNSGGANASAAPNWELGIVAAGLPASTGSIRFKFVTNLEVLPTTNATQFFGAQNSPIDAAEENMVIEWVQDMPLTGLARPGIVDVPASSSAVDIAHKEQDSNPASEIFGMTGTILKEMLPMLLML
jgi:hypothetical protein